MKTRTTGALAAVVTILLCSAGSVGATTARITELIGHPVVTDTGERLGNVEDFAIDPKSGQLSFVVISIGSFLVENSLVAVQPEALAPAASGDPVVLRTEDLEVAHRFNADNWPTSADVRAAGLSADASNGAQTSSGTNVGTATTLLSSTGSATITSGRRKATFEAGKREMINGPMRRTQTKPKTTQKPRVIPNFRNLDRNRDGRLSRAEIGAELNQKSGFTDLDVDANGTIDDFEYAAYLERVARERRWAGNR